MARRGMSEAAKAAELLKHRPARPRPEHTKDRSWEKAQRTAEHTTQVSYRGISRVLNENMKALAHGSGRNVSQVASTFLEYAYARWGQGVSLQEMDEHVKVLDRSASG